MLVSIDFFIILILTLEMQLLYYPYFCISSVNPSFHSCILIVNLSCRVFEICFTDLTLLSQEVQLKASVPK